MLHSEEAGAAEAGEVAALERLLGDARRRLEAARTRGRRPRPRPVTPTEHQLAAALSAADGGSWEWWPLRDELFLSDACWRMIGSEPGEWGRSSAPWVQRIHPEDLALFREASGDCIEGRTDGYQVVLRFHHRGGGWVHTLSSGRAASRDDRGRAERVMGILLNVEPIHRLQKTVEDQNARLGAQVAELAARNRELERFTHVASHDLRSPLRSILGFASRVQQSLPEGGEDRASVGRIVAAGHRMTGLLDALLAYAASGRGVRAATPTELADVVRDAAEDVRHEAAGHPLCVGPLPRVHGDPVLLRQLFQNLLGNAIKYAGGRPPRVSVTAEAAPAPPETPGTPGTPEAPGAPEAPALPGAPGSAGMVRVCVADAGEGVDPADAERVFEPFERNSRSGVQGSGVGLAIVRRVAEQHGGRAWVAMEGGPLPTRFYVELPAAGPGGRGGAEAHR